MSRTFEGSVGRGFTALLGCAYRGSDFTVPPVEGQEVNGFRVAEVEAPRRLVLDGRHRFASYRLTYTIEEAEPGVCRVKARTDAVFPGLRGAFYRTLVIRSQAHAMIVGKMLRAIVAGAEKPRPQA